MSAYPHIGLERMDGIGYLDMSNEGPGGTENAQAQIHQDCVLSPQGSRILCSLGLLMVSLSSATVTVPLANVHQPHR